LAHTAGVSKGQYSHHSGMTYDPGVSKGQYSYTGAKRERKGGVDE
jgi:hypothetical protein